MKSSSFRVARRTLRIKTTFFSAVAVFVSFCSSNIYGRETFAVTRCKTGYLLTLPEKLVARFPSEFTSKVVLYPAKKGSSPAVLQGFGSKKAKNEILFETTGRFNVDPGRKDLNLGIFVKARKGPKDYSTADFNFGPTALNYTGSQEPIDTSPSNHPYYPPCHGCLHAFGLCQYSSPWRPGFGRGICYCIEDSGCDF